MPVINLIPTLNVWISTLGILQNPCLTQKKLADDEVHYLVGMRAKYFWRTCRKIEPLLKRKKKMNVAQQFLLSHMKLRHGLPYKFLAILFRISEETARLCFWEVMTVNYLRTQKFAAQWCRSNLSEEEKNQLYETMLPQDQMQRTVLNKFSDPLNLSQIPVPVCIDSTCLRVHHSNYHPLQKSSYGHRLVIIFLLSASL